MAERLLSLQQIRVGASWFGTSRRKDAATVLPKADRVDA
jgi:hypothetical protein